MAYRIYILLYCLWFNSLSVLYIGSSDMFIHTESSLMQMDYWLCRWEDPIRQDYLLMNLQFQMQITWHHCYFHFLKKKKKKEAVLSLLSEACSCEVSKWPQWHLLSVKCFTQIPPAPTLQIQWGMTGMGLSVCVEITVCVT